MPPPVDFRGRVSGGVAPEDHFLANYGHNGAGRVITDDRRTANNHGNLCSLFVSQGNDDLGKENENTNPKEQP